MTQHEKTKIIEWLYLNDAGYPNKIEWRKEFVKMLDNLMNCEKCEVGPQPPDDEEGQRQWGLDEIQKALEADKRRMAELNERNKKWVA